MVPVRCSTLLDVLVSVLCTSRWALIPRSTPCCGSNTHNFCEVCPSFLSEQHDLTENVRISDTQGLGTAAAVVLRHCSTFNAQFLLLQHMFRSSDAVHKSCCNCRTSSDPHHSCGCSPEEPPTTATMAPRPERYPVPRLHTNTVSTSNTEPDLVPDADVTEGLAPTALQVIDVDADVDSSTPVTLDGFKCLGSYSWEDAPQPTILVPGMYSIYVYAAVLTFVNQVLRQDGASEPSRSAWPSTLDCRSSTRTGTTWAPRPRSSRSSALSTS